ncbi:MAG TPA: thiolase domain-containing protein [Anaerolineales bacterium]|nr:thiolase domain-containing protein [Anaerolineales bacterium]
MRKVAVLGIGQTPVGEHWDKSLKGLAGEAVFSALADCGLERVDGIFVGNMLSGSLNRQENLGVMIADWSGLWQAEAVKVETACSSGGSALRAGFIAVASGEMDTALVVGVEKMTDTKPNETTAALATAADADYEAAQGLSFVAINALVMQRYMHEYRWNHADFAPFSITAHANAVHNPYARLPFSITEEEYRHARMVAEPINLLDASPIGDGAAAIVLVPADRLTSGNNPGRRVITIVGSATATDTIAVHDRRDPLWLSAAAASAQRAYQQAGIGPQDVDFFELHDAFSIMSALSLEACGFAERGRGPRLGLNGEITINGRIPIATRGGLKARGHPVGATGVYQVVEVVQQLRGEAGPTQLERARIGMAQSVGGSGATIVTHILQAT